MSPASRGSNLSTGDHGYTTLEPAISMGTPRGNGSTSAFLVLSKKRTPAHTESI